MRLRLLLVVQPPRVLVEQAVVVEAAFRACRSSSSTTACVLVVHTLDLASRAPTGPRRVAANRACAARCSSVERSRSISRRSAAAVRSALRARRRLLLEQLALFVHDPPRLFGRAQVPARERLDLGQPLASRRAGRRSARRRPGPGRRVSTGRGRQRRPAALGEHLVEEQLARTTGLGEAEVGGRDRVSR